MSASPTIVCPNCGAVVPGRNGEPPRFCGQCGTTIGAPAPPAPEAGPGAPDVHEEVTVARELPNLEAYLGQNKSPLGQTMLDPAPYGSQHALPAQRESDLPSESALPRAADAAAPRTGAAKTQVMAQTLNDPEAANRARQMIAALETPAPSPAPALAPALAPAPPASLKGTLPLDQGMPAQAMPARTQLGMPAREMPEPANANANAPPPNAMPETAAPAPALAASAALHPAAAQRTMLGMPATDLAAMLANVAPPAPSSASANANASAASTPALAAHAPQGAPEPPGPHAPTGGAQPAFPAAQKTMLGVAIPGIAPTHGAPVSGGAPPAPGAAPGQGAPIDLRSKQSTMLGVAIPGIAPTHDAPHAAAGAPHAAPAAHPAPYGYTPQGAPAPPPYVPSQVQNTALGMMAMPEIAIKPRPKTLIDEPLPVAPVIAPKKGVSALTVVGIVAGLVVVLGGALAFVALRRGPALTAVPQLDDTGKESLKVLCPTCPDGTTLALGASSATIAAQNALLPLPAPLTIGDNDLTVKIDRPGAGRDEDVKIHVPVAYRVRADLTTLGAKPPSITVRVEAVAGTEVKVDGQAVALDGAGKGAYAIDLSKETEGTGEAKPYERKIPFVITPKSGGAQTGELTARTAVLALSLDAPGAELFTDRTTAAIAGQTRAGATVTVDGQNVPVDAVGHFGVRVELPAVGPKTLEVLASSAPQAPRSAKVKVTRVASLAEQAKVLETQSPLAYDGFGPNPAASAGKAAVVEGEVVDARAGSGHTVLVVEAKRGCAKGASCLTRVLHGDEDKVVRGDVVRAYGVVKGSVTAGGKTVPEIDASLVMTVRAAK